MTITRYTHSKVPRWLASWEGFAKLMERCGIHSYEEFHQRLAAIKKAKEENRTHPERERR